MRRGACSLIDGLEKEGTRTALACGISRVHFQTVTERGRPPPQQQPSGKEHTWVYERHLVLYRPQWYCKQHGKEREREGERERERGNELRERERER